MLGRAAVMTAVLLAVCVPAHGAYLWIEAKSRLPLRLGIAQLSPLLPLLFGSLLDNISSC